MLADWPVVAGRFHAGGLPLLVGIPGWGFASVIHQVESTRSLHAATALTKVPPAGPLTDLGVEGLLRSRLGLCRMPHFGMLGRGTLDSAVLKQGTS